MYVDANVGSDDEMEPETVFIPVHKYKTLGRLFKFQGDTITKLCQHNSRVAQSHNLEDLAQSWESLNQLYREFAGNRQQNAVVNKPQRGAAPLRQNHPRQAGFVGSPPLLVKTSTKEHEDKKIISFKPQMNKQPLAGNKFQMRFVEPKRSYEVYSSFDLTPEEFVLSPDKLADKAPKTKSKAPKLRKSKEDKQETLKPFRVKLKTAEVRKPQHPNPARAHEIKLTHIEDTTQVEEFYCKHEVAVKENNFDWVNNLIKQSICDIIFYYADNGDLLSSAFMLLVFRNKIAIPSQRISSVLRNYINLLNRMELKTMAAEVIKFCQNSDIQNEYGKQSGVNTKCQYCKNKESSKEVKCYLDKCNRFNTHCSVCDVPVKGRFWW